MPPFSQYTPEDVQTIHDLVMELATEVDLHYTDVEAGTIRATIGAIAAGRDLLVSQGVTVHVDLNDILAKFACFSRDLGVAEDQSSKDTLIFH